MALKRQFDDQLPRWQPWTLERYLLLAGSIAGIAALVITYFGLDHLRDDAKTYVFFIEISALCAALIAYLFVTSKKKLHRYAQSVFFMHYINHVVRDEIASMETGQAASVEAILQDIVNAVANCFSILTGRRCRCCIQEILPGSKVSTFVRDTITSKQSANTESHSIEDNTDYSNIWYGRNGCPRFFICRNLVKLWSSGQYRNSSFATYGEPQTMSFWVFSSVRKWTLPYKATIVWPIRYVPEGSKWPAFKLQELPVDKRPFVWGFLCIDCGSRNTFDQTYGPELGAAFADAVFTYLQAVSRKVNPSSPISDHERDNLLEAPATAPQSSVQSNGTIR
jgi:hypothetical protein